MNRATEIIYEEKRLIPKAVVDEIIEPFLISRQPSYVKSPEYQHMIEEPRKLSISSAHYKSSNNGYLWDDIKTTASSMMTQYVNEKPITHIVLSFDYLLSIFHGLKTKSVIDDVKNTSDEISFLMEYCNIMYEENASAYFKLNMFKDNQLISKSFIPPTAAQASANKGKRKQGYINKKAGEIRIVTFDIAVSSGSANDNTILGCIRALPTKKGYEREVVYIESHNGANTISQAKRVKQLFYDFDADYIVMDGQSVGMPIFDMLSNITRDDERGEEYDGFTLMANIRKYSDLSEAQIRDFEDRTFVQNAKQVIYPIKATSELNSAIAVSFKDSLQRNMISFLIDINKAEEYLIDNSEEYKKAFSNDDAFETARILNPYLQTQELVNECVGLEYSVVGGNIKIDEKRSARKDRYSSVSYGNYFISKLEKDILKEDSSEDDLDSLFEVLGFN